MKNFEKYLVIDEPKNGDGDIFQKVFDDLETANREAERDWRYLTQGEQKKSHIYVAGVNREDLNDYAVDEDTGEIDWTCYAWENFPDGAFDSDNI